MDFAQKTPACTFVLCLLCIFASAQELKPEELLELGKKEVTAIDSIMIARLFVKHEAAKDSEFTITSYTYTAIAGSSHIQRSLHVGLRPTIHVLELEWGVWQKSEATAFIQQLIQMGFKRSVNQIPDVGGASAGERVGYKRGTDYVGYEEMDLGGGELLYIFTIENDHYKQ